MILSPCDLHVIFSTLTSKYWQCQKQGRAWNYRQWEQSLYILCFATRLSISQSRTPQPSSNPAFGFPASRFSAGVEEKVAFRQRDEGWKIGGEKQHHFKQWKFMYDCGGSGGEAVCYHGWMMLAIACLLYFFAFYVSPRRVIIACACFWIKDMFQVL